MDGEHASPQPEQGIGRSLREAREEKGLTLRQVEGRTKIRARYLQDLERENFDVLPTVYVLGSLKTYAEHLGLDGEALSAQLRRRLEPEEPDGPTQEREKGEGAREAEDEYEAAPLLTVGFDHLFLGMGLVVLSTLAVMTLVFALVTNDEPAVSQVREPSLPEAPTEIALAGNVLEGLDRQPQSKGAPPEAEGKQEAGREADEKDDTPEDEPDPQKDDEDRPEQPENASSQDSIFGDVQFVPVSPSSASPTAGATAPATNASPPPATPGSSASPEAVPSSPTSATPEPYAAQPSPAPAEAGAPSRPQDAGAAGPTPSPSTAPSGGGAAPGAGGGTEVSPPTMGADAGRISAGVEADVDRALQEDGIFR